MEIRVNIGLNEGKFVEIKATFRAGSVDNKGENIVDNNGRGCLKFQM